MTRQWLLLGTLGLGLGIVPYLACSSSAPSESAEAGLRSEALLGTWQGSAEIGGETIPFSLSLERAPGKDVPERLNVVGSLTSENPAFDGALDGSLLLDSAGPAALSLRLDDGKILLGTVDGDGLRDGRIVSQASPGAFGLARP